VNVSQRININAINEYESNSSKFKHTMDPIVFILLAHNGSSPVQLNWRVPN